MAPRLGAVLHSGQRRARRRAADATGPLNTGLFDFNKEFKVAPSFIVSFSASYTFVVGQTVLRPAIYVDNVFNHLYALKCAFFSGATFGMPRTVQVRVTVGI